jgi:hypothetical protein
MAKVIIYHAVAKDGTFGVSAATITTGWIPGQLGTLDTTGKQVELAITDETMFVLADDDLELSAPPTGSLVTCVYGAGTKLVLDHSSEYNAGTVAIGSGTQAYKAYNYNLESGTPGQDLYVDADGKFTTSSTGSVKAKLFQVPAAANGCSPGVILRF